MYRDMAICCYIVVLRMVEKYNKKYSGKVVTKISQIKNYCIAEEYHQKYLDKN